MSMDLMAMNGQTMKIMTQKWIPLAFNIFNYLANDRPDILAKYEDDFHLIASNDGFMINGEEAKAIGHSIINRSVKYAERFNGQTRPLRRMWFKNIELSPKMQARVELEEQQMADGTLDDEAWEKSTTNLMALADDPEIEMEVAKFMINSNGIVFA